MIKQNCFCTKKMNYIMRTLNQFRVSNVTVNGINLMLHYVNVNSFCAFHFEKIRSRGRPLNSSRILNTVSGLKYLKKDSFIFLSIISTWARENVSDDCRCSHVAWHSRISERWKQYRCCIRSRSNWPRGTKLKVSHTDKGKLIGSLLKLMALEC